MSLTSTLFQFKKNKSHESSGPKHNRKTFSNLSVGLGTAYPHMKFERRKDGGKRNLWMCWKKGREKLLMRGGKKCERKG